jgi:hypothetical protein
LLTTLTSSFRRRPFFNNSWAARQDQSSLATSIEKPVADEDVQILEPSTSKASADKQTPVAETTAATTFGGLRKTPEQTTAQVTKTTSLFSTTTTEERRIPTLFEERRPHVPVLKGPSGRNVAPNLKSNVFKVPDEDLVVEREEINEVMIELLFLELLHNRGRCTHVKKFFWK